MTMTIGTAAQSSGLNVKTVRYYADIGLIKPHGRTARGYRLYSDNDISRLRLVKNARQLGFTLPECEALLTLDQNPHRASREVKVLASKKLEALQIQAKLLEEMQHTLQELISNCAGDSSADCGILDGLTRHRD